MKLGTFIVGGVAGAAAALYIARKKPGLAAAAGVAAGQLWSGAVRRSMSAVLKRQSHGEREAEVKRDQHEVIERNAPQHSGAADSQAWAQIAALVSSDPAVKRETEKIMIEAGTNMPPH
ncbi:hypothetical protein M3223_08395 [Paenibacillus pasadenensis]|uniref:hypothetical protein n=1 Tax=Paenibacillus pasadenensis TaxID=217090 RepID=UPI00204114B2|nr:hypothetical protein [Paenibacillus pasadenensis]MCM3747373.1 hypothetical protein [Paenibacillus pasadenensis]